MTSKVVNISAVGTRGDVKEKVFLAKPDKDGRYVLNRKKSSSSKFPTNKAVNKVYAETLEEAACLLETDEFLINLIDAHGSRALREYKMVKIERG